MGTSTYLLDKEHLPLYPEFEDNTVEMNEEEPSSVQAHEKRERKQGQIKLGSVHFLLSGLPTIN